MTENLKIGEDVYQFLDNTELNKDNVKELIEYVHYKALLVLFTIIIDNISSQSIEHPNNEINIDFLLPDYIETISNIKILLEKMKKIS